MKLSILPATTAGGIAAFFCFLLLLRPAPIAAQVDTGTIHGTVTDASGRSIPAASVEIKSRDTGFTLGTQSGPDGTYIFTPLHAGTYSVTVGMSGFGKETKTGIKLDLPGFGIQGDYGRANFDIRNTTHLSGGYELPFGKNKRYLHGSGWTNAVAGGGRINGLATFQGGSPITVGCTFGTSNGMGCNALLVPGQGLYAGAHTLAHWLNASAFSNPAPATTVGQTDFSPLGGAPTQASGPRFHRGDLTLAKQWHTTETTRVEFRAEVYNLTNTPNFGNPGSLNFGTARTFASITTTRDSPDDPREFQFALKFYF